MNDCRLTLGSSILNGIDYMKWKQPLNRRLMESWIPRTLWSLMKYTVLLAFTMFLAFLWLSVDAFIPLFWQLNPPTPAKSGSGPSRKVLLFFLFYVFKSFCCILKNSGLWFCQSTAGWCNFIFVRDTLKQVDEKINLASCYIKQLHLTPKDLSFVGYTYKNFDAIKALRNKSGEEVVNCLISDILSEIVSPFF